MAQLGVRRRTFSAGVGTAAAIPDKLYFRIGEVAALCGLPAYVLRFWETEFPQLKPNKGGTGQRLYRRRDVLIALRIKELLYGGGYTIPGARQALTAEQRGGEPQLTLAIVPNVEHDGSTHADGKALRQLREEMRGLLEMLGGPSDTSGKGVQPVRPLRGRVTPVADTTHDLFE